MPAVGDKLAGAVSHVEFGDTCHGFVQLCDSSTLDELQAQINAIGNILEPVDSCRAGQYVIALFSEDGTWYRAIVEREGAEKVQVFFIDYGNRETVSLNDIRTPPDEVFHLPGLATRCNFRDINSNGPTWTDSEKESIEELLINGEFTVEILSTSPVIDVRLYDMENSANVVRTGKSKAEQKSSNTPTVDLQIGSTYDAYISYVGSAIKFWIQLKSNEDQLNLLMDDLAEYVSVGEPLVNVSKGINCIARYSEDEAAYRSTVLTVNGDRCLVQFVDYGNSESKSVSELMTLPEKFKQLAFQGIKCSYKRTKVDSNTLEEKLQELSSSDDGVTLNVVSKNEDGYVVEINQIEGLSGKSGQQAQFQHEFRTLTLESESTYDVCLSFVDHPGNFYVQLLENATELNQLMSKLTGVFSSMDSLSCRDVGVACLARFSDGICYRGAIKGVDGSGNACVLAVDFGFEENIRISEIKDLSPNLLALPAQCLQCTVDVTKLKASYWSSQDVLVLKNLESSVALIGKVTSKRGTIYQLDLFDTRVEDVDRYVNAEIFGNANSPSKSKVETEVSIPKPRTSPKVLSGAKIPPPEVFSGAQELVCVTAVKSANSFFAQVTKFPLSKVADLQKDLNKFYESLPVNDLNNVPSTVGTFCCTKYTDGGWYRAIVTSSYGESVEVTFVDFGDVHTQPVKALKQLQPKFLELSQQCILCQLPTVDPSLNKVNVEKLLTNSVIEVRFGSQKDGPFPCYEVQLTNHRNNMNIATKLLGSQSPSSKVPRLPTAAIVQPSTMRFQRPGEGYSSPNITIGSLEDIMVPHVKDPGHFHCQLLKMANELDDVMDRIAAYYNTLKDDDEVLTDFTLGKPCMAKYTDDGEWYRAKITGIIKTGQVEVLFIDYGNIEFTDKEALKIIKPEFLSLPAQAILCSLSGVASPQGFWSPEHTVQFDDIVLDQKFKATFQSYKSDEDLFSVRLESTAGENINEKFGKQTNTTCVEEPAGTSLRSVTSRNDSYDMKITVDGKEGRSFGRRHDSGGSGDGVGNGSKFGGDRFGGGFRGGFNKREDSGGDFGGRNRAGAGNGFGSDRGNRFGGTRDSNRGGGFGSGSGGFGRSRTTSGDSDGSDKGNRGFGSDRGGGRSGGFGGSRGGGFGGSRDTRNGGFSSSGGFGSQNTSNEEWDNRSSNTDSDGFGSKRGFGSGDRGGRFSGSRGGGFGGSRDSDRGGFSGSRDSRGGGFGGSRDSNRGGFSGSRGGGFGGSGDSNRGGGFGGSRSGGFGGSRDSDRGGGFSSSKGESEDWGDNSSDKGGFGSSGSDRGGRFGGSGRGGFNSSDRGGFSNSNRGRGGGFGSSQRGGFGGSRDSDGFSSSGGSNKSGGFGGGTSSGGGEESWDNEEISIPSAGQKSAEPSSGGSWEHDGADCYASQKLATDDSVEVTVEFVNNPSEFWCQIVKNKTQIQAMMDKMNEQYNALSSDELTIDQLEIGLPCVAKYSEDELWYRGEILSFNGNVEVQFVDYGNSDMVNKSDVRKVKKEFMQLPLQGIRCSLDGVKPDSGNWSDKAAEDFENTVIEKELLAKVINYTAGSYLVHLEDSTADIDVAVKLADLGHCTLLPKPTISCSQTKLIQSPYPLITVEKDTTKDVYVSWIENPQMFWIQPADLQESLEKLANMIQEEYSGEVTDAAVSDVTVGKAVVAQFSEDSAWYRAVVETVHDDQVKVRFIDYGNSDTVSTSSLRQPKDEFMNMQSQAVQCSLADVKPLQPGVWNVDAKDIMESLVEDVVSCKFLECKNGVYHVNLVSNGKSVKEELIQAAVVKSDIKSPEKVASEQDKVDESVVLKYGADIVLSKGSEDKVYVTYIESLSSFYCQLVKYSDDLDTLMENLETYYSQNPKKLSDFTVGAPCVAKYSQDQLWYRACIRNIEQSRIEIQFVDYGNSEKVSSDEIYEIKQEVSTLSPQAVHCSLSNVSGDLEKFKDLVLDKELLARVVDVTTSNTVIELYDGDEQVLADTDANVLNVLYPKQETPAGEDIKVYTSSVISPSEFYIQLADNEQALNKVTDSLQQEYVNCGISERVMNPVIVGSACCTKFSEDDAWYRAKAQTIDGDKVSVLFVDYGNGEEVSKDNIKILKKEIASLPPLAYKCSLHGIVAKDNAWSDEAIEKFESLTMDQVLTCHFVTSSSVILKLGEDEIGKSLIDSGFAIESDALPEVDTKFEEQKMPEGSVAMYVSHIDNDYFYLQMGDDEDKINEITDKLQAVCNTSQPVSKDKVTFGLNCCAKYFADDAWYRAVVTSVKRSGATVRFVDIGNTDDVIYGNLCELEESITAAPFGYMCCLSGLDKWTSEQKELFTALTLDQELTTTFTGKDGDIFKVNLVLPDGKDVTKEILSPTDDGSLKGDESYITLDRTGFEDSVQGSEESLDDTYVTLDVTGFPDELSPFDQSDIGAKESQMTDATVQDRSKIGCIKLTEGQRSQVHVSHVESPSSFYVQLENHKPQLDKLLDDMFEFYESDEGEKLKIQTPFEGLICAAKFSHDESWYRSMVTKVTDKDSIDVLFIDHGNLETTSVSYIRKLVTEFCDLPIQAVECALGGVKSVSTEWNDDTISVFTELTADKSFLMDVASVKDERCLVQLLDMGIPLSQTLIEKAEGVEVGTPVLVSRKVKRVFSDSSDIMTPVKSSLQSQVEMTVQEEAVQFTELDIDLKTRQSVSVSHAVNPGDFWCHLTENVDKLQTYMDSLQEHYTAESQSVPDSQIDIGCICIAPFTEDQLYYRAKVICKPDNENVEVLFVDYGNTSIVRAADLKIIRPDDLHLPRQAVHCGIEGIKPFHDTEKWDDNACSRFDELTFEVDLNMDILNITNGIYYVNLFNNEDSISAILSEGDYAKLTEDISESTEDDTEESFVDAVEAEDFGPFKQTRMCVDSEYDVEVVNVISPYKFHVHMVELMETLETVICTMKNYIEDNPECLSPDDLQPCSACLAYSDDEVWNRARIDEIDDENVTVHFVDYGSEEIVHKNNLRKMPAELLEIPALAVTCKLSGVTPVDQQKEWTDDALTFFTEYCDNHTLFSVYVEKVTASSVALVVLCAVDGEDKDSINHQLVDLAFANAVEGSSVDVVMQNQESETSFNELSMHRQNSYGSFNDEVEDIKEDGFADISCNTTGMSMSEFESTADTSHICSQCGLEDLEGSSMLDTTSESFTYICHKCEHGTSEDKISSEKSMTEFDDSTAYLTADQSELERSAVSAIEETDTSYETEDSSMLDSSAINTTGDQSALTEDTTDGICNECEHELEEEDDEWHDADAVSDSNEDTVEESESSMVNQESESSTKGDTDEQYKELEDIEEGKVEEKHSADDKGTVQDSVGEAEECKVESQVICENPDSEESEKDLALESYNENSKDVDRIDENENEEKIEVVTDNEDINFEKSDITSSEVPLAEDNKSEDRSAEEDNADDDVKRKQKNQEYQYQEEDTFEKKEDIVEKSEEEIQNCIVGKSENVEIEQSNDEGRSEVLVDDEEIDAKKLDITSSQDQTDDHVEKTQKSQENEYQVEDKSEQEEVSDIISQEEMQDDTDKKSENGEIERSDDVDIGDSQTESKDQLHGNVDDIEEEITSTEVQSAEEEPEVEQSETQETEVKLSSPDTEVDTSQEKSADMGEGHSENKTESQEQQLSGVADSDTECIKDAADSEKDTDLNNDKCNVISAEDSIESSPKKASGLEQDGEMEGGSVVNGKCSP